jgi:hypothetical protein
MFYPAKLYNLDRQSINRWSKKTLAAEVLNYIQPTSPTAKIWGSWRLENWGITEEQGHVIRHNRLTLSKTTDLLDVRCVLSNGSYKGVLYLSVFWLNQKNRKVNISSREESKRENSLQNSLHVYRFSTRGSTALLTTASCWRPRRQEQIAITRMHLFYRYCMEFETNELS